MGGGLEGSAGRGKIPACTNEEEERVKRPM